MHASKNLNASNKRATDVMNLGDSLGSLTCERVQTCLPAHIPQKGHPSQHLAPHVFHPEASKDLRLRSGAASFHAAPSLASLACRSLSLSAAAPAEIRMAERTRAPGTRRWGGRRCAPSALANSAPAMSDGNTRTAHYPRLVVSRLTASCHRRPSLSLFSSSLPYDGSPLCHGRLSRWVWRKNWTNT